MERRTFLKSVTAAGALFTTAGCLGGGDGTGSGSTNNSSTTGESTSVPNPDISFKTEDGVLKVVHMGGDEIKDENTTEVYVTVDGERATTWVADDEETQEYPISVGNFVETEAAKDGSTVEVVWVDKAGNESVLATHEVSTEETTTTTTNETTTSNETATNETVTTTTNETAVNSTTTTTGNETTTTTTNETTTTNSTTTDSE